MGGENEDMNPRYEIILWQSVIKDMMCTVSALNCLKNDQTFVIYLVIFCSYNIARFQNIILPFLISPLYSVFLLFVARSAIQKLVLNCLCIHDGLKMLHLVI